MKPTRVGGRTQQVCSLQNAGQLIGRNQSDIAALASANDENFVVRVGAGQNHGEILTQFAVSCFDRHSFIVQGFCTDKPCHFPTHTSNQATKGATIRTPAFLKSARFRVATARP